MDDVGRLNEGRSSTWTRIRVNLRRPDEKAAARAPDPDDDPTREWRERLLSALRNRKKRRENPQYNLAATSLYDAATNNKGMGKLW